MIEPRDELAQEPPAHAGRAAQAGGEPPADLPDPRSAADGDADASEASDAGAPPAHAAPAAAEPVVSEDQVKLVLRRVKDPELNLNVVDLGLIYAIRVEGSEVQVDMSLTSPGCPSGPEIMRDVESQLRTIANVTDVQVNLVWSPYWSPERIEPRVRAYLGF